MKTKPFKKRVWLNPVNSSDNGYVIWGKDGDGDYELQIADCSRIISLNVSYGAYCEGREKVKGLKNGLKKVQLLLDNLNGLKKVIQEDLKEAQND